MCLTINGLSQLNFERDPIVIFVIVKHMCPQLEELLHILRARFWQNNTRSSGEMHGKIKNFKTYSNDELDDRVSLKK